jgi:NAD(P)-dependent dehydrogenase (short-subunit alcohol dehydrogenase family)
MSVVVITGGSAGIGRAAARTFARRGYDVGLIARGPEGLKAACDDVRVFGARAFGVPCDVADPIAVDRAAESIERELGEIDVWVNNAMVSVFAPVVETTPEEYRRVTEVTYLGYVHGTIAALKRMRPRDSGVIVQVGSALAYRSIPLQSAYCAAKHAVKGFTESLRTELLHEQSRIHLTEVHLPAMNTPQFGWSRAKLPRKPQPVPPIFQPELAADAIVFAAEHTRRQVAVGFPVLKALWAEKIAPGYTDRYLADHGFEAQQTNEPANPHHRDNLFEPVPGDAGAHGAFDDRALSFSLALWLNKHRVAISTTLATCAIGAYLARG